MVELAQELVDEYAWSMLVAEIARAIGEYDEPVRLSTIVEELNTAGLAVGAGLVKAALESDLAASDDRSEGPVGRTFARDGRRWDLAVRATPATNLDRVMRDYLSSNPAMPTLDELARQVALAVQQGPRETRDTVVRIIESRDTYFVHGGRVGLRSWLLDTRGGSVEDVILDNFFDEPENANIVEQHLELLEGAAVTGMAQSAFEALGPGLPVLLLQYAWWRKHPDAFDAVAVYAELACASDLHIAPDRVAFPREAAAIFAETLRTASAELSDAGDDEAELDVPAEAIEIGENELRLATEAVNRRTSSVPVEILVEEVLEVRRDEPGFRAAASKLDEALQSHGEVAMCGRGRWIAAQSRPDDRSATLPEALLVAPVERHTSQGEEIDAELDDVGLEGDLADQLHDPAFEDVGDEDEVNVDPRAVARPGSVRWIAPYHHYLAGSMKVRKMDGDFYGGLAGMAECVLRYEQGPSYTVWAHFGLGVLVGLREFYQRYCPPSGAVLELRPTDISGEFHLRFDGETDESSRIDDERLTQLLALRDEARDREMSVLDVVTHVLSAYPSGAPFQRIVTDVNVARRTRRRMVASILAQYHCFHSPSKATELWALDPRKIEQGRKKQKRKHIRRA